jgi:hypothetical protein
MQILKYLCLLGKNSFSQPQLILVPMHILIFQKMFIHTIIEINLYNLKCTFEILLNLLLFYAPTINYKLLFLNLIGSISLNYFNYYLFQNLLETMYTNHILKNVWRNKLKNGFI